MHEFSEEVVCRCGGAVEVAEQDTWFLCYNDEEWKAKAHEAVAELDAIPENTREQYDHTIDWLNEWPCIRNYGLGTRLPWDDDFVIEPLSDSTIYMAYYTIAHRISDVPVEEMDEEFFDTLFYGSEAVDEPNETALSTARGVGLLVSGRLPLFRQRPDQQPPDLLPVPPRRVVRPGRTGRRASPSWVWDCWRARRCPPRRATSSCPENAIEKYGADTVRFFLMNSAEPWQDYDWRSEQVESTGNQLDGSGTARTTSSPAPEGERDLQRIDRWLLSKLQATVREATDAMDRFETRSASQAAFYGFEEHLKWYRKRTDTDRPGARWTLRTVLNARLRLLAPFVPFMANGTPRAPDGKADRRGRHGRT